MSRNILIAAVAAVVVASSSVPVLALHQNVDPEGEKSPRSKMAEVVESTPSETQNTPVPSGQSGTTTLEEKLLSQQEKIDARKAELKQRLDAKVAERKEKLEGRRLAQCQNRQDNINSLMIKSATVGEAKLSRIQSFQKGITNFYSEQGLSSDAYDISLANAEAKEAMAIAALQSIVSQKFDCTKIDGSKPSDTIKSTHETKREALKEYRDSVQQLLKVVREAFAVKAEAQR